MMKKIMLVILAFSLFITGCARTATIRRPRAKGITLKEIAKPESAFTVGERLTYIAAWKGIPVGTATATIEELTTFKGYEVYKIVVVAKTNKFLSKLFPVTDTYISYMDKKKFISRRYEATLREGRYKKDLVVDYDFEKNLAIYKNSRDGSAKTSPIESDVRDPVCAAYYFRTIPIELGKRVKMAVNLCENNYEINVDIAKTARVDLHELGIFDAFLVKPFAKLKGKRQRRGKAWGYLSADNKRIALYAVLKVLEIPWVGSVTSTLQKIENITDSEM